MRRQQEKKNVYCTQAHVKLPSRIQPHNSQSVRPKRTCKPGRKRKRKPEPIANYVSLTLILTLILPLILILTLVLILTLTLTLTLILTPILMGGSGA